MFEHTNSDCRCKGKQCIECEKVRCHGSFFLSNKDEVGLTLTCRKCYLAAAKSRKQEKQTTHTDLEARLLASVEIQPDGCWFWKGRVRKGYGRIIVNGKHLSAHRLSYELFKGPIPDGFQIDHLCNVCACVNPAHLEAVTQIENLRREQAYLRSNKVTWADLYRDLYMQVFGDHIAERVWRNDAEERKKRLLDQRLLPPGPQA